MVLEPMGYSVRVAHDGKSALQAVDKRPPDLMILDMMLPDLDGLDVCRQVRERHTLPIVALTCLTDTKHKNQMLDAGALDYLTKPLRADVLLSRVQAALSDVWQDARTQDDGILAVDGLRIDLVEMRVTLSDREISLTPTEYRLLCQLAAHTGHIHTHQMLLHNVWGRANSRDLQYLHVYIGRLRRKIEADPTHPTYIITVPYVGYKMCAP